MASVHLNSDGSLTLDGKGVANNPLVALGAGVEVEDGVSLRSFFKLLEKYPVLAEVNSFLPSLVDAYRTSPVEGCTVYGLTHLELVKTVEMIGFPGKPRMQIFNSFIGVAPEGEACELKQFQVESLLDHPVRLGRLKHIVFGDRVDIHEFGTAYTLFEFIDGIAWELSFHGTPMECEIRR